MKMSLLKELLITEEAAGGAGGGGVTAAGSIASNPWGGSFTKMITRAGTGIKKPKKSKSKKMNESKEFHNFLLEDDENAFDPNDVISKLKSAEKKIKGAGDTVSFGLEDENGKIVRVTVKTDQAKDFESTLGSMLSSEENDEFKEDDDSEGGVVNSAEIAEILYSLRDKFDIVDVDWGDIEPDQENEEQAATVPTDGQDQQGGQGGQPPADGQQAPTDAQGGQPPADQGQEGGDQGAEGGVPAEMDAGTDSDEESAKSALSQVIDMMKADAEARKAEADARKAKARAMEAKFTAQAAEHHIKKHEQSLDMEDYYNKKKDTGKEAKQIAKLARFKHDLANDNVDNSVAFESEDLTDEIELTKLADYIYDVLRAQK
jgi:hypothetical protein